MHNTLNAVIKTTKEKSGTNRQTEREVVGNPGSVVHEVFDSLHESEDLILRALGTTGEVLQVAT